MPSPNPPKHQNTKSGAPNHRTQPNPTDRPSDPPNAQTSKGQKKKKEKKAKKKKGRKKRDRSDQSSNKSCPLHTTSRLLWTQVRDYAFTILASRIPKLETSNPESRSRLPNPNLPSEHLVPTLLPTPSRSPLRPSSFTLHSLNFRRPRSRSRFWLLLLLRSLSWLTDLSPFGYHYGYLRTHYHFEQDGQLADGGVGPRRVPYPPIRQPRPVSICQSPPVADWSGSARYVCRTVYFSILVVIVILIVILIVIVRSSFWMRFAVIVILLPILTRTLLTNLPPSSQPPFSLAPVTSSFRKFGKRGERKRKEKRRVDFARFRSDSIRSDPIRFDPIRSDPIRFDSIRPVLVHAHAHAHVLALSLLTPSKDDER